MKLRYITVGLLALCVAAYAQFDAGFERGKRYPGSTLPWGSEEMEDSLDVYFGVNRLDSLAMSMPVTAMGGINVHTSGEFWGSYGFSVATAAGIYQYYFKQTSTIGTGLLMHRALASTQTDNTVFKVWQDAAGDDQPAAQVRQDGTGSILQLQDATVTEVDFTVDSTIFKEPASFQESMNVHGTISYNGVALAPTIVELNYVDGLASSAQDQIDALPTFAEVRAEIEDSLDEIWTQQGTNTTNIATNVTDISNHVSDVQDSLDTHRTAQETNASDIAALPTFGETGSLVRDSLENHFGTNLEDSLTAGVPVSAMGGLNVHGTWTYQGVAVTPDVTEINYVNGLSSGVQGQIDDLPTVAETSGLIRDSLDLHMGAARDDSMAFDEQVSAMAGLNVHGSSGFYGDVTINDVSDTEIDYLNGVTGGIQGQIDAVEAGHTTKTVALTIGPNGADVGVSRYFLADSIEKLLTWGNDTSYNYVASMQTGSYYLDGTVTVTSGDFMFLMDGVELICSGSAMYAFTLNSNVRNVLFDGVDVLGTGSAYGFADLNSADSIKFNNIKVHGFTDASALVFEMDTLAVGIRVENSEFWDNEIVKHEGIGGIYINCHFHNGDGATGLYINAEAPLVQNCKFYNAGSTQNIYLDIFGGSKLSEGAGVRAAHAHIIDNEIIVDYSDSTGTGIRIGSEVETISYAVIEGNHIYCPNPTATGNSTPKLQRMADGILNYGVRNNFESNIIVGAINGIRNMYSVITINGGSISLSVDCIEQNYDTGATFAIAITGTHLQGTNGIHNVEDNTAVVYDAVINEATNLEVNDGTGSITGGGGGDGAIP